MSTLLITGGTLVDERSVLPRDVLIADGRVAQLLEPGQSPPHDEILDARGLHVMPGVVDAHVHFNEPGRTHWEGFLTGTTAAAAGGVTTVCDMPLNCHPPTLDKRALLLKRAAVAEHALVDYALWGGVGPGSIGHLAELQAEGVVGVKGFLCDSGLAEYPFLDEFALLDAMQACADLSLLLALHAEDPRMTRQLAEGRRAAGGAGALDWARSRPVQTEVDAVARALEVASTTAARVHFVHLSTGAAARLVAQARANGVDASCETCPHYLALDESDLERLGASGKCAPPLRAREVVEELWQAVLDGHVDFVASDHSPCPPDMKHTPDIWSAWGGLGGVQTTLRVLLSAARLELPKLVSLSSAAPARRLGLYPKKGALEPGSDADLVLLRVDVESTLEAAELRTRWPHNPFLGRTLRGRVEATLVRGTTVFRDGSARVEPGFGQLVRA